MGVRVCCSKTFLSLTLKLISAGGMAQKYTYQVTPTCGKKPRIPVFTLRTRARRQAGKESQVLIENKSISNNTALRLRDESHLNDKIIGN